MVLLLLCMVMLSRVRSRLVVCVDGFALNTRDSVTVGRGSNVAFDSPWDEVPMWLLTLCQATISL